MSLRSLVSFIITLMTLLPALAQACPSCFSNGNPQVLRTYYLTAALMTVLPFLVIGTIALWLRYRFKEPS
jgi:predicted cobalt transporter CbtA